MYKVIRADFHQAGFIAGLGQIGSQLPGSKSLVDLEMTAETAGLLVSARLTKGSPVCRALVPYGNVVIMTLAAEDKAPKAE